MIKSKRHTPNKHASSRRFKHAASKTHPRNLALSPMRGGVRL